MTTRIFVTNPAQVEAETGSLMFPRILSHNLASQTGAIVTAGAAAGFPAIAARSDNTYERWRPSEMPAAWHLDIGSAQPCNACAIAAHDLAAVGARVIPQWSPNGLDPWTWLSDEITITTTGPLLFLFPAATQRFFRLHVAGPAPPTIGHIRFGVVSTLEHGIAGPHVPIDYARRVVVSPSRSEGGQWLGASVRRIGQRSDVQISGLTWDWWRTHGDPFVREARDRARPFFFAWNPARAPQDVAYCTLDADVDPAHRAGDLVDVTLSLSGFAGP